MVSQGKIVVLSGPSGSGKTTLYNRLLKSQFFKGKLVKSISMTTRPKRMGEKHGRDYYFVSPKMFEYKIRAGHFLEWEKVFGNYYGTPKRNVHSLLKKGIHVLLCIDVKGAKKIFRSFKKSVTVFIKPPNIDTLKQRLQGRASDSDSDVKLRLETAMEELAQADNYQHVLINSDLDKTYKALEKLLERELFF